MSVTHQDVIDYIEKYYGNSSTYYKLQGDMLKIKRWVTFGDFEFDTLPERMIFDGVCDLRDSNIEKIPNDILVYGNLFLNTTNIHSLPFMYISNNLNINYTDIVLTDGIYIGGALWSLYNDLYKHFCYLQVSGYFFSTGVLS